MRYVYDNPKPIEVRPGVFVDATACLLMGWRFFKPIIEPDPAIHSGRTRMRFTHIELHLSEGYFIADAWVELKNDVVIYTDEPKAEDQADPKNTLLTDVQGLSPSFSGWLEENVQCLFSILSTAGRLPAGHAEMV